MGDMFDYISWRGDLSFSDVPFGPADALLFSTLVYLRFEGIIPPDTQYPVPLHVAADAFSALADADERVRSRHDLALLRAAADADRFRDVRLCCYCSRLLEQEKTQFAAMACILTDGTAFLAFRGTDNTLIGWQEDFNMSFCDSVPAQREAAAYVKEFADNRQVLLRLGGHSKGGNLAVYAGAKQDDLTRRRILGIYNLDGPGFTDAMLEDPGYLEIVPKIHTYIPESSVIGMLLEHEEDYSVIKSRQIGLLQHEPYSWEVLGADFVRLERLEEKSCFLDSTMTLWLEGVSEEQREFFVETVYKAIHTAHGEGEDILVSPKVVFSALQALLGEDEETKRKMGDSMKRLLQAARQTAAEYASLPVMGGKKESE